MTDTEIWRDVAEFEGRYQVSNLGRIKSLERKTFHGPKGWRLKKEIILSPNKLNSGYLCAHLCFGKVKAFLIHRLVAAAFLANPLSKREVNHINGNKADNRVENLEWATSSENKRHAFVNGLYKPLKGAESPHLKLLKCSRTGVLKTAEDVANELGYSTAHVYSMVTGRRTNKTNYQQL